MCPGKKKSFSVHLEILLIITLLKQQVVLILEPIMIEKFPILRKNSIDLYSSLKSIYHKIEKIKLKIIKEVI